jgi:hypothetical protein
MLGFDAKLQETHAPPVSPAETSQNVDPPQKM